MDFKTTLENFALSKDWRFKYARRDYQNLIDAVSFIADEMEGLGVGETVFFCDPIVRSRISSGILFSGNFMILTKSDFDDDYDSRYTKYIKPAINVLFNEFKNSLICDYDIDELRAIEVINVFDFNADGISVNYRIRNYG